MYVVGRVVVAERGLNKGFFGFFLQLVRVLMSEEIILIQINL